MRLNFIRPAIRVIALLTTIFITACSQKVDGTSLEAFQASFKQMTAKMSAEKAAEFDKDLTTIMSVKNFTIGDLRGYVNGMTADDVHKAATTLSAVAKAERISQLKTEIAKLEQQEAKADSQKAEVAKFRITVNDIKGQWKFDPEGYERPENQSVNLSLTLQNKSPYTIAEFGYDLTSTIDGRENSPDPWSYKLDNPLASGQTVTLLITDKGRGENDMNGSISGRVTKSVIEAIKANPKSALSAKIKLTSITVADGTRLDAEPARQDFVLKNFKRELAELTGATPAG